MKALVGAFDQEKALVGAFYVIVKTGCGTDGSICGAKEDACGRTEICGNFNENEILMIPIIYKV